MKITWALALVILAIAISAKAESKQREHHSDAWRHEVKEYVKSFGKKGKPYHHHKTSLREDKHEHKNIKHPIEIPPHEGHIQGDLRNNKKPKDIKGHDAWHKKDMHLQDLSFDSSKPHHEARTHKVHHTWPHHSQTTPSKHETTHHKSIKSGEHHIHKSSTENSKPHHMQHEQHAVASARAMTKSFHHTAVHPQPAPTNKKSHNLNKPEHGWGKSNKKQKKTLEKQKKQKLHRKKQFKGELHKLW